VAIVLVNAVGGLVALSLRGRGLGAAAHRAVLLAVGDGLASQVPSLLVAVAAGVAVTRVAAEEEGERLGAEVGRQLLADPRALATVAAVLGAVALAPGLPALPFAALAAGAGGLAWRALRAGAPGAGAASETGLPADADPLLGDEPPVVLELADDLLAEARADGARFLDEALPALRAELRRDLGVPAPPVAVRGAPLEPGGWLLLVHEVPVARGRAPLDERLALAPLEDLELAGLHFAPVAEPRTGRTAALVDPAVAARAAALGPVLTPLERVASACAAGLERHAALLLGVQEVQALLDELEATAPALVREAARQLPPALLAEVLRRLVDEGVPIRPLRTVLEALLEAGGGAHGAPALAAAARRALRRRLSARLTGGAPLAALLLDPAAERAVRESLLGEVAALDPAQAARLNDAAAAALAAASRGGGGGDQPVLLTSGDVRRAVRLLVAARHPRLLVIGYDELPPDLAVRPVGRLALAA